MNLLDDSPRFELVRIAGIPVRVDITFALVPLFLLGSFGHAPFATAAIASVVIVAGVFMSVLFHELGHATVARLSGIPVSEILVGGFYGYARMLETPQSTLTNVTILSAGPFGNAVLFLGLWSLLGFPEISTSGYFGRIDPPEWLLNNPSLLHAVLTLALINLAMLIFNLLPAFPLDGGRMYRDLLAMVAPRRTASRMIAGFGVGIGLWSALVGLRIDIVLMLIGAQIAILNWAVLMQPADLPHL